jgi:hypothetical protein
MRNEKRDKNRDFNDEVRDPGGIDETIDEPSANGNGQAPNALGAWKASTITKPPPRGWLLGNSFCRGFVSSLLAGGGTGKTALRTLQVLSFVTGRNLTGEYVFFRGRALIISLEDNADELNRRVLAACLYHNIPLSELDGLFLTSPGAAAGKLMAQNPKTGAPVVGALAAKIEAAITQDQINLLVIDPLVKAHSIPENDNTGMDEVVQLVTDLAAKYDIAVDVPHHISKGTAEPGNAERGRGASASVNAARLVYTLAPMASDEAKTFNIMEDDRRAYVRYDRAKLNVARTTGPATWFKLVGVCLDNATEAYPAGDEVQTVEVWKPPETWADTSNEVLNRILDDLAAGPEKFERYSNAPAAGADRAAWRVVQKHIPAKPEPQCRAVINIWLREGVLRQMTYKSPKLRKTVSGLEVVNDKRPGTESRIEL